MPSGIRSDQSDVESSVGSHRASWQPELRSTFFPAESSSHQSNTPSPLLQHFPHFYLTLLFSLLFLTSCSKPPAEGPLTVLPVLILLPLCVTSYAALFYLFLVNHLTSNSQPIRMSNMLFKQLDPRYDVWVAADIGDRQNRILVIRTRAIAADDPWVKVTGARILLAGSVERPLTLLMRENGRPAMNELTANRDRPSGLFTSSNYTRLRKHLNLS